MGQVSPSTLKPIMGRDCAADPKAQTISSETKAKVKNAKFVDGVPGTERKRKGQ